MTDSGKFEELGKDLPNQKKTVVILSTPSFTTWLQNDHHFIADALKTIFPFRQEPPAPDSDATEVQTILAVVDGLSPSTPLFNEPLTAEGFSIMVCVGESRIPGYDCKDLVDPGHPETTQIPNITFHLYDGGSIKNTSTFIDVAMPLANTLFRNGRASTLLLGRWKRSPSDHIFHQVENSEKQSCTIPTDCSRLKLGRMKFDFGRKMLLTPLTVPRPIASGLGNIVRQLADSYGNLLPASVELEKSVVSFLERKNLPQQTVSVWAWIIPAPLFHAERSKPRLGFWESLRKGAGLHRVCKSQFLCAISHRYVTYSFLTLFSIRWWRLGSQSRSPVFRSVYHAFIFHRSTVRLLQCRSWPGHRRRTEAGLRRCR